MRGMVALAGLVTTGGSEFLVPRGLLVEDDGALAEAFSLALGALGDEIVPAESGKHALEALPGGAFDVVRDVMLPGVDGFEVCRRVRAGSLVPVILLTACGDPVGVVV